MKLDADLRAQFMAAAEASHRPASQVVRELMRDVVREQHARRDHDVFVQQKVAAARGRPDAAVEADVAARRARITGGA